MFTPITTERLLLRPTRRADAQAFYERRNDPEVAELQDWDVPFPLERAEAAMAELDGLTSLPIDDWWVMTIADVADTQIFGDLVFKLENDGRTAEVGYSLDRAHWGQGYASEALSAVVSWLFAEQGVSRVSAMLHPDNARSARVLERCGFLFEGHLRNSYWRGDENSDDWVYGMTPEDHARWTSRSRSRPENIELLEPYPTGLRHVVKLATHRSQEKFVSPIQVSLAQMAIPPYEEGFAGNDGDPRVVPWARIVHADGEPVGFVMVEAPTVNNPEPYLWRLLIDRLHQRRGIGKYVIEQVIDQARAWGSESMTVSWVPGVGSPEPLYLAMGFEPTGEIEEGEIVGRLVL